jgi:hypothetical protein
MTLPPPNPRKKPKTKTNIPKANPNNPKARSGEQEWEQKQMSEQDHAAHPGISMNRDEKKAIVFVEIGDNLKQILSTAISCASANEESIADLMSEMGVNIKAMVESTTKMEGSNSNRSGE